MITAYAKENGRFTPINLSKGEMPPEGTAWIDLLNPENNERIFISTALGIDLPTVLEMQEIEASSRLYTEGKATYLTIDVLVGSDTPDPVLDVLLVAMTPNCLVTMRYCEPHAITTFANRIKNQPDLFASVDDGLLAFLDAITDRVADILEVLGRGVDNLSRQIFHRAHTAGQKEKQLQDILQGIGRAGDTTHKIRDSINGMARLITFLGPRVTPRLNTEQLIKFQALDRDVNSLGEHAQFVAQETSFLLDATLGQINIEQNNILKIMSVVMVAFTPPTFFASMWGMNFHNIPEYSWSKGYLLAWAVMLMSCVLPLMYFRRRGWL
ncbi:MAG: magnesium transporter CorA family protein [Alphaproteobacteria bacterium]